MILLIDNYDSFTYNLYHYLLEAGEREVLVKRNDQISISEIEKLNPSAIVLSPGPCTPDESGICLDIVKELQGKYPILGVCLGHQVIGQVFGANIIRHTPMHGKISDIYHQQQDVFKDLPSPFKATRYHSLIIEEDSLPLDQFHITARTDDKIIMGIAHKMLPIYGVQFHPESIASEHGHSIIKNFLEVSNGS